MQQASLLMRFTKLISLLAFGLVNFSATAMEKNQVLTMPSIQKLAKQAVAKKITHPDNAKVIITPQSVRFTLPACNSKLKATLSSDRAIGKNNTVKISCQVSGQAYPWTGYILVKAEVLYPVVVAKNQLAAGEKLTQDKLDVRWVEISGLRGEQFEHIQQVEGTRTKRRVSRNMPLYRDNLCFVCKGDTVAILAGDIGFSIKTQGEAMNAGNPGDKVRIKNLRSNKMLDAIVIGIGKVEVKI